jgi:hypothetical protein
VLLRLRLEQHLARPSRSPSHSHSLFLFHFHIHPHQHPPAPPRRPPPPPPTKIPLSALVRPDSYLFTIPAISNAHSDKILLHLTAPTKSEATLHLCTDTWALNTTAVLRPSATNTWDLTHIVTSHPTRLAIVTKPTDRNASIWLSIGEP